MVNNDTTATEMKPVLLQHKYQLLSSVSDIVNYEKYLFKLFYNSINFIH